MVYCINKIYIKNFKLFEDIPQPISLGDAALTVLDGPNGFGKTSIFDVIELILTGKLKRIKKSDARIKYNELLLQNNSSEESILKIEFKNTENDSTFTLVKTIPANFLTEKNSPDDFDIFDTHLLDDFWENPSNKTLIDDSPEKLLIEKFGVDITNIFNLVYYIEQEDSKYFLRMNESERLDQISMLFNTEKQEFEVKKYREVRRLVNREKKSLDKDIIELDESIKKLDASLGKSQEKVNYFKLLPHLSPLAEWDKKELKSITYEVKEKYILELSKLEQFLRNFKTFTAQIYNENLNNYLEKEELLEDFVILKSKTKNTEDIINQYKEQTKIFREVQSLTKENFILEWKNVEFDKIFEYFNSKKSSVFPKDIKNKIDEKIKELEQIESNASKLSEGIRELINARENFITKFSKIHDQDNHEHESVECPLCGEVWKSYKELIENAEKKERLFEGMLDDTSNLIKDSLDNLYQTTIKQLYSDCLEYFKPDNEHIISSDLYKQISKSKKNESHVNILNEWLSTNHIDFKKVLNINNDFIDKRTLKMYSDELREFLKSKLKHIEKDLSMQELELFSSLYSQYFNNNSDLVNTYNENLIQEKKKYINFCYYNNIFAEKEELTQKVNDIRKTYSIYDSIYDDLGDIISEYDIKIKSYWKQIIKDIEIVFYIYSAKILQTHQRGTGIFLKESDSKIIRFITHPSKDHDVANFMSSGQLSAIILALTLSLNKVYGNKGLTTLLIDDPLQTMDDINTSSFIELLRNDFADKQIILSTHEENISSFIKYKFSTYNLRSQSINLKDEFHS